MTEHLQEIEDRLQALEVWAWGGRSNVPQTVLNEIERQNPPIITDSIDWDAVSSDWCFLARNKNGEAFLYDCKPLLASNGWVMRGRKVRCECFSSYRPGNLLWDGSLIVRPGTLEFS